MYAIIQTCSQLSIILRIGERKTRDDLIQLCSPNIIFLIIWEHSSTITIVSIAPHFLILALWGAKPNNNPFLSTPHPITTAHLGSIHGKNI